MYCASLRRIRAVYGLWATHPTALRMQSWIASTGPDSPAAIESNWSRAGPAPTISVTISSFDAKWW